MLTDNNIYLIKKKETFDGVHVNLENCWFINFIENFLLDALVVLKCLNFHSLSNYNRIQLA